MIERLTLSVLARCAIIPVIIMMFAQTAQTLCPTHCKCEFDDNSENNTSKCQFGDSFVNFTYGKVFGQPVVTISCQGSNYTCEDLPQFDHYQSRLVLRSCAPSTLKCINTISQQQASAVEVLELHGMTGPDEFQDWETLVNVTDLRLYLKETDPLPVHAYNALPLLKQLYIEGGDFNRKYNTTLRNQIQTLTLNKMASGVFPNVAFDMLKKNIKILHITESRFDSFDMATFKGMPSLEELELRYNDIKKIQVSRTNSTSESLKILKMQHNTMKFLPRGMFDGLNILEKIIIENNKVELTLGHRALAQLPAYVDQLVLNNCKVRELPADVLTGASNVHEIQINNNLIEDIKPTTFDSTTSVRRMVLSGNNIRELNDDVFVKIKKLQVLDLSRNKLNKLNRTMLGAMTQLNTLLVGGNNLTKLEKYMFEDRKYVSVSVAANRLQNIEILRTIPNWKTGELDLSGNEIEVFEDWFLDLPIHEYLDLSSNKIKSISNRHVNAQRLSSLTINFQNNSMTHITGEVNVFSQEDKLKIYLSNNPFDCDCMSIKSIQDFNRRNIIIDFKDLKCNDGVYIRNIDVHTHCHKTHAMIALIGTSAIGAFFGFIVLVSIIAQWNNMWKYISRYIMKRSSDSDNMEMDPGDTLKEYDIFISFAHQDQEYVSDHLLPKLEFEYGLKVCVHYRDWVVGELIPDQIIQSVYNTSITIIVLTENFLLSEWSNLEFRTAHNMALQENRPKLLVILLNESITKNERLGSDIKSYIAKNNYVVWEDPNFWKKLEKALTKGGVRLNKFN